MTNRKNTRRALVLSLLSLLLCCSMLVGTTFAWFTDSVTSGNNKIVAGNLDVELKYAKIVDGQITGWEDVKNATEIFDPNALWEPGRVEVAYLQVTNEGTLALKYQLGVNVASEIASTSVLGNKLKLSEHLVFKVVEMDDAMTTYTDREAVAAAAGTEKGLKNYNGTIKPLDPKGGTNAVDYVALIVYMPESVGNEANYRGTRPEITLGVNLVATQLTAEEDSFGSDYDTDATYPIVVSGQKGEKAALTLTAKEVVVIIPESAAAGHYTLNVSNKHVATSADGKTTVSFNIDLLKDGVKVEADGTTKYAVQINVGKNLDVSAVTHNGTALDFYSYDPITGIVSFETASFSPFAVIYEEADGDSVFVPSDPDAAEKLEKEEVVAVDESGNEYTTAKAAIESGASKLYFKEGAELGTITHLDVDHSVTIYGNGAKMTGDFAFDFNKNLTADTTVTIYNLHGADIWGNRNTDTVLNVNLHNCNDVRVYLNGTGGETNIGLYNCVTNKATLEGDTGVYSNTNGKIVIDGCTFNNVECPVNLNHKIAGEQTVIVKNSTFVDCATEGTAAYYAPIRMYNSVEGANQTLTVAGNTFTYSEGKAPVNKADILLNAKHNGVDATGTIKADVQADATVATGANVTHAYTVANAEELKFIADEVNKGAEYEGNTYEGKTVKLTANIDLGGAEWTPIGNFGSTSKQFKGVFDGQNHTVSNFKVTQKSPDREGKNRSPEGFFGNVNGTIKNLTIAKANVTVTNDGRFVGGIIGRMNGGLVENCKLVDSHVEGSAWQIGGIVGQVNAGTIRNCVVEKTTVVGKAGVAAVAGFQMEAKETTIEKCAVKDCTIEQKGSYGEGYDDMFAAVIGCVNNSGATVNINGCTVETTTVKGEASSALYGYIEDGAKVYVDGFEVIADGLAKNGTTYNVSNANGLAALNAKMVDKSAGRNVVVNLTADIDMTGKTWTPVDSHADTAFTFAGLNGNDHTISNLTVSGQAMFKRFSGTGDVTIKDVTFDNAVVSSTTDINCSVLTVQTYQNVLLDNVDVKNSAITGRYKVAPLIATVYNESPSAITATIKNCDVSDTTVTATQYDFCTAGMVAFVYEGDNDKVVFENCTVTNVKLYAPNNGYTSHAWVYVNDADEDDCFNEVAGVTVTNCTFENN